MSNNITMMSMIRLLASSKNHSKINKLILLMMLTMLKIWIRWFKIMDSHPPLTTIHSAQCPVSRPVSLQESLMNNRSSYISIPSSKKLQRDSTNLQDSLDLQLAKLRITEKFCICNLNCFSMTLRSF